MRIAEKEKFQTQKGFSLVELIIYIAIFAVVAGAGVGILTIVLRVQSREMSSAEVVQQANFVMQTVQRLVRESSLIEMTAGGSETVLKLRMKDAAVDPILISSDGIAVYLKQGAGATTTLTDSQVKVDELFFRKYQNPGAHDGVTVDLSLSYNTENPQQMASRTLRSVIARVSAATFDTDLLPNADGTLNIGLSNPRWATLRLSNLLYLGSIGSDPAGSDGAVYYNTASNVFRGYRNGSWQLLGGWNASSADIYNANSGNVGIGTTTPATLFSVATSTNIFNVTSGGRVGVGTTSPLYPLSVVGQIFSTDGFRFSDGTTQTTAASSILSMPFSTKTSTYTVTTSDAGKIIAADASSGALTINLPAAATAGNGFTVGIKKISSDANAVTIDGSGTETIDGSQTQKLIRPYDAMMIATNGTGWYSVARRQIVAFRAHKNGTDQVLSAGTTKLTWAAVTFDTASDFDLTNERYTVSVPGLYCFQGLAYLTATAADVGHSLTLWKNGVGLAQLGVSHTSNTGYGIGIGGGTNCDFASVGDYYELGFGANSAVTVSGNAQNTYFSGFKVD
ncbi:MAG: prepilin-type N-terminal cleavage/methylation domain-containing protein [Parcubacteria group bacterium]|nr:prepilin-type N-terminal cleavage/methylation domain-containing protein [Parcubacteria group bacterium]